MNKLKVILLVLTAFHLALVNAQDVHFSQFGQTPQLINPAATGVFTGKFRGFLNYRSRIGSVRIPESSPLGSVI